MIQVSTLSKKNDLSQQRNADLSPMQVSPVCTSPTIRHQNSRAINITTIRNQQTVLQPFNVLQGEEDSNQSANACKSQWLPIYRHMKHWTFFRCSKRSADDGSRPSRHCPVGAVPILDPSNSTTTTMLLNTLKEEDFRAEFGLTVPLDWLLPGSSRLQGQTKNNDMENIEPNVSQKLKYESWSGIASAVLPSYMIHLFFSRAKQQYCLWSSQHTWQDSMGITQISIISIQSRIFDAGCHQS